MYLETNANSICERCFGEDYFGAVLLKMAIKRTKWWTELRRDSVCPE
jgi:hypothetical protein